MGNPRWTYLRDKKDLIFKNRFGSLPAAELLEIRKKKKVDCL
jgi:hypothetical protein